MKKIFCRSYMLLILLSVICAGAKGQAKSDRNWTEKKAAQWFKTEEWLNKKDVNDPVRKFDAFGRELFDAAHDSDTTVAGIEPVRLKPHPSVNKLEFAKQYHANKAWWDKAFAFLKETDLAAIKPGKYPIDGDNVFAIVTEGLPRRLDTTKWESHHNYQDIHYVISGKEQIGITGIASLTVADEYNPARDLIFYTGKGKYYAAVPGVFFIFFPKEAHRPNIQLEGYTDKKIVIKVRRSD